MTPPSPSTLKGLSAKITFQTDAPSHEIAFEITSELENVRQIQRRINEIVTEKIGELRDENKVVDLDLDDEEASDDEE